MLKNWLKFIEKNFLWLGLGFYLFLTLPALLDQNHFLYNLEPYPDGLLYALSGKNFWLGRGLKLIFSFGEVNQWVPPLYSIILGLPALILKQPYAFYLINILISISYLAIFYWLVKTTTKNKWTKVLGLVILLSHSLLMLLPSLPMTENLTLLFFILLIASFFVTGYKRYLLTLVAFVGAMLTRYSILPVLISGLLIIPLLSLQKASWQKKLSLILFALTLLLAAWWFLSLRGINILGFLASLTSNVSPWQGTRFIYPNFIAYSKMLLFNQGLFLWLNIGLTNLVFFGLFLISWVVMWKKKLWPKYRN